MTRRRASLTELEGAVLGVIWSRRSITAYGVRQRFLSSPTRGWSSSHGAIYPAVERLIRYGFVAADPARSDRRATKTLTVTQVGSEALRQWLMGLEEWMGGATVDPIRTRVNYFSILSLEERKSYLADAERNARAALAELQDFTPDPAAHDSWGLEAASVGIRLEVEARLKWLGILRERLEAENPAAPESDPGQCSSIGRTEA